MLAAGALRRRGRQRRAPSRSRSSSPQALGGGAAVGGGQVRLSLSLLARGRRAFTLARRPVSASARGRDAELRADAGVTLARPGTGPAPANAGGAGLRAGRDVAERSRAAAVHGEFAGRTRLPAGGLRAAARRSGGIARARPSAVAVAAPLRSRSGLPATAGPTSPPGSRWRALPRRGDTAGGLSAALQSAAGRARRRRSPCPRAEATPASGVGAVDVYTDAPSQLLRRLTVSATLRARPGPADASAPRGCRSR